MDAPTSQSPPWQASKLLIGLPETTPLIKFVNMQHLKRAILEQQAKCCETGRNGSPFLVVFDIPSTTIRKKLWSYALGETLKVKSALDLHLRVLVLEVAIFEANGTVSREFDHIVRTKAKEMGTRLLSTGRATVDEGDFWKEPAQSWKPFPGPGMRPRTWPTVTLEVGLTESIEKLAADAQGWIEPKGSGVQTVITIKVDTTRPKVTIQKWEEAPNICRMTRSGASYHRTAEIKQEAIIEKSNGVVSVTGGLDIQFERMFDRPKNRNKRNKPEEKDFIFSNRELEYMVEPVWIAQLFE